MNVNVAIAGRNLKSQNINDLVRENDVKILIFLRHMSCNMSRQLVRDLRTMQDQNQIEYPITYISQGSKNLTDHYWKKLDQSAQVVYDTNQAIAKSFGLKEGTLAQLLGPAPMFCALKAMVKGQMPQIYGGNVYMMPGVFVYRNATMVYKHIATHAGDFPDFENMVMQYLNRNTQTANAEAQTANTN